jgi:protein-S-isoprenylcysteine O-methyltransferase Ste14
MEVASVVPVRSTAGPSPNGRPSEPIWPRPLGVAIGTIAQLAFAVTVFRLFFFLGGNCGTERQPYLVGDLLLALQFSVLHSVLLHPVIRRHLNRWVPRPLYGSLFCLTTCATLLLMMSHWTVSPIVVYELAGLAEKVVVLAYYAAWLALVYSLFLSGMGYQTGFTPWWHWLRGTRPPLRSFTERQVYRYFRHPIYVSFLGLIWLQPRMSLDRVVLTAVWTAYILIGSYLKDERMAHFVGEPYRDYQRRVPGFPFVSSGVTGRRRSEGGHHIDRSGP